MIKILLVDDQKILLEGLVKILTPLKDIRIIGTCTLSELAEEACMRPVHGSRSSFQTCASFS